LGWAGRGAQRLVLRAKETQKTGASMAGARTRGRNPLPIYCMICSWSSLFPQLLHNNFPRIFPSNCIFPRYTACDTFFWGGLGCPVVESMSMILRFLGGTFFPESPGEPDNEFRTYNYCLFWRGMTEMQRNCNGWGARSAPFRVLVSLNRRMCTAHGRARTH
jgi:hypothetical protein